MIQETIVKTNNVYFIEDLRVEFIYSKQFRTSEFIE